MQDPIPYIFCEHEQQKQVGPGKVNVLKERYGLFFCLKIFKNIFLNSHLPTYVSWGMIQDTN